MKFRSYRAKLIIYMVILICFLAVTFGYSYKYVQQVMLEESNNHLLRLKQLFDVNLNTERNELKRYAAIVAQDLRIREYLYVITGIGGSSEPLRTLYEREFGWLPIDRKIILTLKRKVLIGEHHTDLIKAFQQYQSTPSPGAFYYQGAKGLEMVAVAPIKYRDNTLGHVVVSHLLNQQWLEKNKLITGGEFFMIQDGRLTLSTLAGTKTIQLHPNKNTLIASSGPYHVYQIDLPGVSANKPELWFGLSESSIIEKLNKHRSFMLGLLGVGTAGVLIMGLLIIRNFSQPLKQIGNITRQVVAGELPALEKSKATNEFEELKNNFSDMLKSLREQQKEIEETHRNLEKSAITDSLTGLYNRRYLQDFFPKLFASVNRDDQCVYGMIMDLDYFKKINDTYGHIAGDQCLVSFSSVLQQATRSSDHLFRLGGEEFLILSVHKSIDEAVKFADKIRRKVETSPVVYSNNIINLTVSCGVSRMVRESSAESALRDILTRADAALYEAKDAGRNRICAYRENRPLAAI